MGLLSMGKSPRPICDVCNCKVEQMDIEQHAGGKLLITVQCHGATERFEIDPRFAAAMDKNTEVKRVFVREKLGGSKENDAVPALPPPVPSGKG